MRWDSAHAFVIGKEFGDQIPWVLGKHSYAGSESWFGDVDYLGRVVEGLERRGLKA